MFIDSPNWKIRVRNIQTLIYVFICTGFVMFVAGYFYGSTSSKDVGYGFFRSTLSSLIDPSGWSILIPDLPETEGSYEGFAFLGIPTLIILILNIFLFKKSKRDKSQFSFISLWAASIILFIFSLSNNIAFSNNEFLSLPTLESLSFITSSFRSTGRF
jgi:hypothetical protein